MSAPLIVTAELPGPIQAWADRLRREHFPPERNQLAAHVTLFHALPWHVEAEARALLAELVRTQPPKARIVRIMDLGRGTALGIESAAMLDLRHAIADRFHGLLTAQDQPVPRLHVTIQNKVAVAEARDLQATLAGDFAPRDFAFAGLALHHYRGGPWEPAGRWSFRG
nr:2'-5' RNA ligase family protein [Novosphingobium lentum]